jgi:hypothetical protein
VLDAGISSNGTIMRHAIASAQAHRSRRRRVANCSPRAHPSARSTASSSFASRTAQATRLFP